MRALALHVMADRANDVIKMPSDDFGFPSTTLPTLFVPKMLTVYKFDDAKVCRLRSWRGHTCLRPAT